MHKFSYPSEVFHLKVKSITITSQSIYIIRLQGQESLLSLTQHSGKSGMHGHVNEYFDEWTEAIPVSETRRPHLQLGYPPEDEIGTAYSLRHGNF